MLPEGYELIYRDVDRAMMISEVDIEEGVMVKGK